MSRYTGANAICQQAGGNFFLDREGRSLYNKAS